MQIRLNDDAEKCSYEVFAAPNNPVVERLLSYLQRESLPFKPAGAGASQLRIGPLHPQQAATFESQWRPFLAAAR